MRQKEAVDPLSQSLSPYERYNGDFERWRVNYVLKGLAFGLLNLSIGSTIFALVAIPDANVLDSSLLGLPATPFDFGSILTASIVFFPIVASYTYQTFKRGYEHAADKKEAQLKQKYNIYNL